MIAGIHSQNCWFLTAENCWFYSTVYSKSMLIKEIPVYSEEFDIHGVIKDYGVVTKLFFTYENREIVMGIDRNPLEEEKFEDMGRNLIESYVRNLLSQDRKLQLHYWYIAEHEFKEKYVA